MQAMKDWHKSHPHLFVKSPRNHAGWDNGLSPEDRVASQPPQSPVSAREQPIETLHLGRALRGGRVAKVVEI